VGDAREEARKALDRHAWGDALTLLRLTLVPVFVTFLLAGSPGWRIAAFVAFGIASVTDILDGELARRRSSDNRCNLKICRSNRSAAPTICSCDRVLSRSTVVEFVNFQLICQSTPE